MFHRTWTWAVSLHQVRYRASLLHQKSHTYGAGYVIQMSKCIKYMCFAFITYYYARNCMRMCLYIDRLLINNNILCKKKSYWCFTASSVHFSLKLQWIVCTAILLWTFSNELMLTTIPWYPNAQIREKILSSSWFFEASYTPSTFLLEGIMKELPQNPKINQIKTNATWGLGFILLAVTCCFRGLSEAMKSEIWKIHFTSFPDKKNVWHACQC